MVLGVAASTRHDWYDAGPSRIRLELLAPHGALLAAPKRVVWRSSDEVALLQFEWRGLDGRRTAARRLAVAGRHGAFDLTIDEQAAIEQAGRGHLALLAVAPDGRMVAESAPAAVTVVARVPRIGDERRD